MRHPNLGAHTRLVEVGRRLAGGREVGQEYALAGSDLRAVVEGSEVRIESAGGVRLILDRSVLRSLSVACTHWAEHRDSWAAFDHSRIAKPYFPGSPQAYYFWPPGVERPVELGRGSVGRKRSGREEEREVVPPREIAPGVVVTAEIWQTGHSFGGELPVGLAYSFADTWFFAWRRRAWLHAEKPERSRVELGFGLLPGEERFFSKLRALPVSVQAVDTSFKGSAWAKEKQTIVP